MFDFDGLQEYLSIAGNTLTSYNTPENHWVTTKFADLWYSPWAMSAKVRTFNIDNDGVVLVFEHKRKVEDYISEAPLYEEKQFHKTEYKIVSKPLITEETDNDGNGSTEESPE